MRSRLLSSLTGLAMAGALLPVLSSAATAGAPDHGEGRAPVVTRALNALAGGPTGTSGDVTIVLRDLAYALPRLKGADRRAAESILARPTDPSDPYGQYYGDFVQTASRCWTDFCMTWATQGPDAPPMVDTIADGVPDWVETTRDTVALVLDKLDDAGFRAPVPDQGPPSDGSTTQVDIYLANLGDDGIYGYCVPDLDDYDSITPAYCVLDNDFQEYPDEPLMDLSVTATHELFHLVQFGYDATEAPWFLESTSTWLEDEFYDSSDDNLQYLSDSPLSDPTVPLDDPDRSQGPQNAYHPYGSWIFWRFLGESRLGGSDRGLTAVRKVWELAGDGPAEPNQHGVEAVRNYVESQGADWGGFLTDFALANRHPESYYEEGRRYPAAPAIGGFTLQKRQASIGTKAVELDHLSSGTVIIKRGFTLRGSWKLALKIDGPDKADGARVALSVYTATGKVSHKMIALNASGNAAVKTDFSKGKVKGVALTFVNAGTRYRCDRQTYFSCAGESMDDERRYLFSAKAVR